MVETSLCILVVNVFSGEVLVNVSFSYPVILSGAKDLLLQY